MKAASELLEKERKRGVKEGIARALLLVLLGCALALLFGCLLCSGVWGKVVLAVVDPVKLLQSSESLNHWHWICLVIDRPVFNKSLFYCFGYVLFLPSTRKCLIVRFHCWFGIPGNPKDPKRICSCYWYDCWMTLTTSMYCQNNLIIKTTLLMQNLDIQLLQVSASDSASPDAEKLAQEAKQQFSSLGDKTGEALATWIPIVTQ